MTCQEVIAKVESSLTRRKEKMYTYQVSINRAPTFDLEAKNGTEITDMCVENYLEQLPEKSTAHVYLGEKFMCLITKNENEWHWKHNGYMFSG